MKKVVKFGGSSLASAEQFKKVGEIIRAEESRVKKACFCAGSVYIRLFFWDLLSLCGSRLRRRAAA